MHDRTRRMLCRAGFLAVCLLPTLGVIAWSNSRTSATHSEACAADLSRDLSLRVSLSGVSYPQPGNTLYEGVEIADPETAVSLARLRFLNVGAGENLFTLIASQSEVDALQLGRLWEAVEQRLRQSLGPQPTVRLVAREATLHWPVGSQTLTDVLGELATKPESGGERTATLSFRLAGKDSAEPIRVRYARTLKQSRPMRRIELNSATAEIPCSLLVIPLGIQNRLGERARFRGSMSAVETPDGWNGELTGEFKDVDLQAVISEQFPHQLSGAADVAIQHARFEHGRLIEARGTIVARPGVISQSLLQAAAQNLQLKGTATDLDRAIKPYDQLAISFTLDSSGLSLGGLCEGSKGTIVRRGETALLAESGAAPRSIAALLRTLVPMSELQVPATRESNWLIDHLPVPSVMPPVGERPRAKLQLAPKGPAAG
jgi:hypothetical protein